MVRVIKRRRFKAAIGFILRVHDVTVMHALRVYSSTLVAISLFTAS